MTDRSSNLALFVQSLFLKWNKLIIAPRPITGVLRGCGLSWFWTGKCHRANPPPPLSHVSQKTGKSCEQRHWRWWVSHTLTNTQTRTQSYTHTQTPWKKPSNGYTNTHKYVKTWMEPHVCAFPPLRNTHTESSHGAKSSLEPNWLKTNPSSVPLLIHHPNREETFCFLSNTID